MTTTMTTTTDQAPETEQNMRLRRMIEEFADQVRDDNADAALLLEWGAYLLAPSNHPGLAKGLLRSMAGDLDELVYRIEPGGFDHDDDEEA